MEARRGKFEFIPRTLALQHGKLFPILNYEEPDPECPINAVTSSGVTSGETFINVSITPQGQASAILVRRWDE